MVAIFPNVCLWRRNLCSNLENCIEPTSYASTAYVVAIWPSFLFRLFCKNLGHLREFFGQMVYCPPWQKISRTPMQRIVKAWMNPRWGGGLLPYISHIGMCWRVGFLRRFRLELGIVLEGTTECMNIFIVSIPDD